MKVVRQLTSTVAGFAPSPSDPLAAHAGQPSTAGPGSSVQAAAVLRHALVNAVLRNALVGMMAISDPTQLAIGMQGFTDGRFQPFPAGLGVAAQALPVETLPLALNAEPWPLALSAATCPLAVPADTCPLTLPADTPLGPSATTFPFTVDAMGRGTAGGPDASAPGGKISYAFRVGNADGRANGFLTFDVGQTKFTFSGTVRTLEVLEVDEEGVPRVLHFTGISSNRDGAEFQCTVVVGRPGSDRRGQISLSWQGGPMAGELPLSTIDAGYMRIESSAIGGPGRGDDRAWLVPGHAFVVRQT